MDIRRKCPEIMLMRLTVDGAEHVVTIKMPRLTFEDGSKPIFFN